MDWPIIISEKRVFISQAVIEEMVDSHHVTYAIDDKRQTDGGHAALILDQSTAECIAG
jgi:hypothetical protein